MVLIKVLPPIIKLILSELSDVQIIILKISYNVVHNLLIASVWLFLLHFDHFFV